jgi:hypothetical protein
VESISGPLGTSATEWPTILAPGNETADQLAKVGAEHPFIGPEPACGISTGVARKAIRDWTIQAKRFIQGPSAKRVKELLKLNRNQL